MRSVSLVCHMNTMYSSLKQMRGFVVNASVMSSCCFCFLLLLLLYKRTLGAIVSIVDSDYLVYNRRYIYIYVAVVRINHNC